MKLSQCITKLIQMVVKLQESWTASAAWESSCMCWVSIPFHRRHIFKQSLLDQLKSLFCLLSLLSPLHNFFPVSPTTFYFKLKTPQSSLFTQIIPFSSAVFCLQSSQSSVISLFSVIPFLSSVSPYCLISSCDLSLFDLSVFNVLSLFWLQISPRSPLALSEDTLK